MPVIPNQQASAVVGFVSRLWNRTIQPAGTKNSQQFPEITTANPAPRAASNHSSSLSTQIGNNLQNLFC